MRQRFQAFIPPDKKAFKELWTSAIVVLDTNVVLNLYRFSDSTRDEFLDVLDQVKVRLWMPDQVGWEFFRRRSAAMIDNEQLVLSALKTAKKAFDESADGLRGRQASTHHLDDIAQAIDQKIKEVEVSRDDRLDQYNAEAEPVLERILGLFDGRVAKERPSDWLKDMCKEGRVRYEAKIPPGYCDANAKKGDEPRSLYGDYLLWREVLEYAKDEAKNVILVTNDSKDDWVERVAGKTLGPRREMLDEFKEITGKRCWVYAVRPFLQHARSFIKAKVSDKAMSEVDVLARSPTRVYAIDSLFTALDAKEDIERRIRAFQAAAAKTHVDLATVSLTNADADRFQAAVRSWRVLHEGLARERTSGAPSTRIEQAVADDTADGDEQ